ncbi:MAG: hypothetical protein K6C97_09925 [Treponema sp.]|nr:hypothetical protein [Treponema sp.]
MSKSSINTKDYKFGLNGAKKKLGINYWRFFFNGVETISGSEQMFFVELEMVNPWLSPSEVLLGFKPRVKLTADDLQYALAGTQSAQNLDTEQIVQPSYCSIRVGMLGKYSKQICYYFPIKDCLFNLKPFELQIGNKCFTENKISGFLSVSQEEQAAHPELFSDAGYATWDLSYEIMSQSLDGYNTNNMRWFPHGLHTIITGKMSFDGSDYIVDSRRCNGYIDRFWGNNCPEPWFHLSTTNLTSVITGKTLLRSAFAIQGTFEDRVSFQGKFEDLEISFPADASKRQFSAIWDCTQMPEAENPDENLLHWSVSLNNKTWVLDIDVYCKIKELYNRKLELPEGSRKVLNLLEGASGYGEIKLYKHIGNTLEQIEHAKLIKVVCEFGQNEDGEI